MGEQLRPFTPYELADQAIGLFLEYRDIHGYAEADAHRAAALEVAEGAAVTDADLGGRASAEGARAEGARAERERIREGLAALAARRPPFIYYGRDVAAVLDAAEALEGGRG